MSLGQNSLTGTIPTELGLLSTYLATINLLENNLLLGLSRPSWELSPTCNTFEPVTMTSQVPFHRNLETFQA
eukprot:Nitzschia sp. Nitz4//scaffold229_size32011//31204//31419//NITZ4_007924-RA/size32011-exonerate_protein2genome-gene-0.18-mRNA-1//1//CDS//3329542874//317//frame0